MPANFAHTLFGREVLAILPFNVKRVLELNRSAFDIGLHGPDIYFFHKPFSKNKIREIGGFIHQRNADEFLSKAKKIIKRTSDNELYSYAAGFICHFMLDSECHPYIAQKISQSGVSHAKIEAEFDRKLMLENGLDPFSYNTAAYLNPARALCEKIAMLYPVATGKDVYTSIKSMKKYTGLFVCKNGLKRSALYFLMDLSKTKKYHDIILTPEPDSCCSDSNARLYEIFYAAIAPTAELIENYCKGIPNETELSGRFQRNFE